MLAWMVERSLLMIRTEAVDVAALFGMDRDFLKQVYRLEKGRC